MGRINSGMLSKKQKEIMSLVLKAAGEGKYLRREELQSQLSYGADVSHQAVECSIRYLVEREFLVRHYDPLSKKGRPSIAFLPWRPMVLVPTAKAFKYAP